MKAWDDAWKTESGYFDRAAIDRHFTAFQDGRGGSTGRCWPGSVRTDSRRTQSWLRASDSACGTRMPAATTAVATAITAAARNTDS